MIDLRAIGKLSGMNFWIPAYQRGYRWKDNQVKDLLEDIGEFIGYAADGESYCLQPLVVKRRTNPDIMNRLRNAASIEEAEELIAKSAQWEVIDGQQRLTTIFLILSHLGTKNVYTLDYQTRTGFPRFLSDLTDRKQVDGNDNIDSFTATQNYDYIKSWFAKHCSTSEAQDRFRRTLLDRVKVIWYESTSPSAIDVFTRLNIGKIPLSDAALIKALVFQQSNDADKMLVAAEWDTFEYRLQDDEFWYFIFDSDAPAGSRLETILKFLADNDALHVKSDFLKTRSQQEWKREVEDDKQPVFRYFNLFIKDTSSAAKAWKDVKDTMAALTEWFDDRELYHYIGFILSCREKLWDVLKEWRTASDKKAFRDWLKKCCRKHIAAGSSLIHQYEYIDDNGKRGHASKRATHNLLLLLNIEMVVLQNRDLRSNERYKMDAFYRFPFHLYKKEAHKPSRKGWEIEHIASNSGDNDKHPILWLEAARMSFAPGSDYDRLIDEMIELQKQDTDMSESDQKHYDEKYETIKEAIGIDDLTPAQKNRIWNFTLLDSATNEEYGNSIFAFKRICVFSKERGKKTVMTWDEKEKRAVITETDGIAFVPTSTKNIFAKAYTKIPQTIMAWTLDDCISYRHHIEKVLGRYLHPYYQALAEMSDDLHRRWLLFEDRVIARHENVSEDFLYLALKILNPDKS